jgi:hypothetical protein
MEIREQTSCPVCGMGWRGEDILAHFTAQKHNPQAPQHHYYKNHTPEQLLEVASYYGYTVEKPVRFSINFTGIELHGMHPLHRDGISYYQCLCCHTLWDRFTNEQVPASVLEVSNVPSPMDS